MAEAKVSKLPFELKDVTSYWTAVVALVGLGLVLSTTWLALAKDPVERSVAGGGLFVLILAALAFVSLRPTERAAAPAGGLDPSNVREGVSAEQVKAPQPNELPGPDGSYMIVVPPPAWEIDEREFAELLQEENRANFGTDQNPFQAPGFQVRAGLARVLRAPNAVRMMPIAHRTQLNGRPGFSWTGMVLRSELYVLPFERAQPPLFSELPFPQMAFERLFGTLAQGFQLRRLEFGKFATGEPQMIAEAVMELRDVLLDEKPVDLLRRTYRLVVARADVRDFAIAFQDYAYEAGDRNYGGEIGAMETLLASFRPVKVANPSAKAAESRRKADAEFDAFLKAQGRQIFSLQLQFAIQRVAASGLKTAADVTRAVDMLRPFKEGASRFPPQPGREQGAASLWTAFDAAAQGEPAQLRAWIAQAFPPVQAPPVPPPGAGFTSLSPGGPAPPDPLGDG